MESKYYKTWEEYKKENPDVEANEQVIAPRIQTYEERMLGFILFLCV